MRQQSGPRNRLRGHALETAAEAYRPGAASAWTTGHDFFEVGYLPQVAAYRAAARSGRVRAGGAV
jgi:hypothetical protein